MCTFRCSYIPPVAPSCGSKSTINHLLIDVKWHDYPIPDSPFLVPVYSTSPAQRCFITEYPASHLVVGRPITAIIDATKVSNGHDKVVKVDFEVVVTHGDRSISEHDIKLREESNSMFAVEFTPPSEDVYLMDIYYQKKLIADSGLKFVVSDDLNRVNMKCTPPKTSSCDVNSDDRTPVTCPPLVNPQLSVVSFMHDDTDCLVTLRLIAKHSMLEGFLGENQQHCVGKKTGNALQVYVHKDLEKEKNGEYAITLCTAVPDVYSLSLRYFGDLLTCCPYTVDMCPAVTVFDPVVPFRVGTSSFIELVFNTSEAHKTSAGDFKVKVLSATSQSEIPTSLSEVSPQLFLLSFRPIQDEDYSVHVSWFCLPIAGSPFNIHFRQRLRSPQVKVHFQSYTGLRTLMQAQLMLAGVEECPHYSLAVCVFQLGDTVATKISEGHAGVLESSPQAGECTRLLSSGDQHTATSDDAESISDSYSVQDTMSLPRIVMQQYKRGHYEIWFVDFQAGKYSLDVLCSPRRRINGSPFLIDTTTIPRPALSRGVAWEMMESMQICRETRRAYLAASVTGEKLGPVSISMVMTPCQEKAIIKFDDEVRDVYALNLYWYTQKYELFKGAPFLLTEHHKSAINASKDNAAI